MSSLMERDKENQEQQNVGRKGVGMETSAPRTPFAEVNRQRVNGADLARVALKSTSLRPQLSQDTFMLKTTFGVGDSSFTPHRTKPDSLFKTGVLLTQVLPRSQPASPADDLPQDDPAHALPPALSQSCPTIALGDIPLPAITETPPSKIHAGDLDSPCNLRDHSSSEDGGLRSPSEPRDLSSPKSPAEAHDLSSPKSPSDLCDLSSSSSKLPIGALESSSHPHDLSSPPISPSGADQDGGLSQSPGMDLSLGCEEGTPLSVYGTAYHVQSEDEPSFLCEKQSFNETSGSLSPEECETEVLSHDEDVSENRSSDWSHNSTSPGRSSCDWMSEEGSETDSPDKETCVVPVALLEVNSSHLFGDYADCESVQAANSILTHVLDMVEKQTSQDLTTKMKENDHSKFSSNSASVPVPHQSYLSAYARFVESYDRESPGLPNMTSSLTDVTPFSQDSALLDMSDCHSAAGQTVADNTSSFLSDSEDSFSSFNTLQRHLSFDDKGFSSSDTRLDESTGFVRSSQSRCDLREVCTPRGDSVERDFLNLSVTDQRVEFISLPTKLKSAATSPIDVHTHNQSCSPMVVTNAFCPTVQTQNVETMTTSVETRSVPVSPIVASVCEQSTLTDTPVLPDCVSVGLSPILHDVHEKESNTSITHTSDADTMTHLVTSEVALSPMLVPKREVDTMTTVARMTESGMTTETAECMDHSMLATVEQDCKTTMTDSTGRRNTATTMTPFKTMLKQGRRLTSDDVRKQHPRALANQLDTLSVTNNRLEENLRTSRQDHKRLQGALKDAKHLASSRQAQLEAADKVKQDELKEREQQQQDRCQELEQLCQQHQDRVACLEQELVALKAEGETAVRRQAEDVEVLEAKCQELEERHRHYENEIEDLKRCEESNSYRQQFERAQNMVRQKEAELSEIRDLFDDLQTTTSKQEQVYCVIQNVHHKIVSLAKENKLLRESVARRASLPRETVERQGTELAWAMQQKESLEQEVVSLKTSMALNNNNLSQLEKLYSVSSSDLLSATGQVLELNSDLFHARKTIQETTLTRDSLARQVEELQDQLSASQESQATLQAQLQHTHAQLQDTQDKFEKLQVMKKKMQILYEDKLENLALGAENVQRTLERREVDSNNLEKDLYECRNIILEQRYKIDSLQSQLSDTMAQSAQKIADDEDVEFYKKSNAFLEAERCVYAQSIRDLEEKLQAAEAASSQQQQLTADAEEMIEELQADKIRLISDLSDVQKQFLAASSALTHAREEQERAEGVVLATANDVLQHMHLMLDDLKKKIGVQDVPDQHPIEPQPRRPPSHSRSVKSKRHSRKSFVSSILSAVHSDMGSHGNQEDSDMEKVDSGSYLGDEISTRIQTTRTESDSVAGNRSLCNREVKEVSVSSFNTTFGESRSGVVTQPATHTSFTEESSRRKKLNLSSSLHPLSVSWTETRDPNHDHARSSAFRPVSSTSPRSLPQPPVSGVAHIRSIPKTKRRSEPPRSTTALCVSEEVGEGERGMVDKLTSLKEVFSNISRLSSILHRATDLSLRDLREENAMLRERTEIQEQIIKRKNAELELSREETVTKDNTIHQLQKESRDLTGQMMAVTDQKFHIKRLSGEVKRMESELQQERGEKAAMSVELNSLLSRMETTTSSPSTGTNHGAALARYTRDIIALKKKNQQLSAQLEEQRDHYEGLGAKAARRMRVLEENWRKAEDELFRLDDLVETIRQISEKSCRSSSSSFDVQQILRLIQGDNTNHPCEGDRKSGGRF